ncbi:TPA: hypothetical protein ACGOYC_001856 [Streptococcus suis]
MNDFLDISDQNIITVSDEEIQFFENFAKKNALVWRTEDKINSVFPISKSYTGYIITPKRKINLLPKYREISFEHIFRMYLYVYGYRSSDTPNVLDVSSSANEIDISKLFFNSLQKNIQGGIIQHYSKVSNQYRNIKGTVNFSTSYINYLKGKRKPIQTRVSKLTLNSLINQLIVTALKKLQHIKNYTTQATSLLMYFEGIDSNIKCGSETLKSIVFNSNTSRYRQTLIYAAMIIDDLDYDDVGNSVGTESFIINFDRLFEDFVVKILKSVPLEREFITWRDSKRYAEIFTNDIAVGSRDYLPDILYKFILEDESYDYSPSAFAVLDVKNKAYGTFKNADIYQILMYAQLLHSEKAVLIYPSFSRRASDKLRLTNGLLEPSEISACFVNIADESGKHFLDSINIFVTTVENTILDLVKY